MSNTSQSKAVQGTVQTKDEVKDSLNFEFVYHGKDGKGKAKDETLTVSELAKQAVKLNKEKDKLVRAGLNFGDKMLALRAACEGKHGLGKYKILCANIEAANMWGKAPKGSSKVLAAKYDPAPQVWKDYKSYIIGLEENFSIQATGKQMLTFPDTENEGQTMEKEINFDSISKVKTQYNRLNKEKREAEKPTEVLAVVFPDELLGTVAALEKTYTGLSDEDKLNMVTELSGIIETFSAMVEPSTNNENVTDMQQAATS
ncbi:MAG: hypothetical protein KAS32_28475 [Candidatus Peribacteraceae bacterium]|nr:hypothetical protein [Candidatus Peribacteraceae bacterium]